MDMRSAGIPLSDKEIAVGLLDSARVGIWKWNLKTGSLIIDDRWAEIVGYSVAELQPITINTWYKLLYPQDRQISEEALQQVFDGKTEYYNANCRMIHKNGSLIWVFVSGKIIQRAENGEPLWMAGMHSDVTNAFKMENDPNKKCDHASRFFDVNIDMLSKMTRDGVFIQVNSAWKVYLGYEPAEMVGHSITDFIHPDDIEKTLNHIKSLPEVYVLNAGFINRYRAKDGQFLYLEWRSQPIRDAIYSSTRDITSQKKSDERFRALFKNAPVPYLIHDKDTGQILETNQTAVEVYRAKSAEELINSMPWAEPPYSADDFARMVRKAAAEGTQSLEWADVRLDGERFWSQVILSPITIDDHLRVLSVVNDISRIKKAEAESLAARNRLEKSAARQRMMLQIVTLFMKSNLSNFNDHAKQTMDMFGKFIKADKVFICSFNFAEDLVNMDYLWNDNDASSETAWTDTSPSWRKADFHEKYAFTPSRYALPTEERIKKELAEKHQIKNALITPVDINETYYGYIGIDANEIRLENPQECKNDINEYATAFSSTLYRITTLYKLVRNEEMIKRTLLSIGDGVIVTDQKGQITLMNRIAETLTGYQATEAMGKSYNLVFDIYNASNGEKCPDIIERVIATGNSMDPENHALLKHKEGGTVEIENSASPIIDTQGKIAGVVIVFRNCSEKKAYLREIEYLSYHDALTGLYNRRYMEQVFATMDVSKLLPLTVMFVDVNGLKLTNDAFGHKVGDKLLILVTDILKQFAKKDDIIGRVGGDEFILILPQVDEKRALQLQNSIQERASRERIESIIVSIAVGFSVMTNDNSQTLENIRLMAENRMYKDKLRHGKTMRSHTIDTVLRNINNKYDSEQIHTEIVAMLAEKLAIELGLPEREVADIKTCGILHDIGKIIVPAEILNKPGKLTKSEFEIVMQHPETGYQILKSVDEYAAFAEAVLHHHERWDGKGYPHGLKGNDIPYWSRIIAIADAFEAMTASRPYQISRTIREAIEEIKRCSGSQFDPEMTPYFVKLFDEK